LLYLGVQGWARLLVLKSTLPLRITSALPLCLVVQAEYVCAHKEILGAKLSCVFLVVPGCPKRCTSTHKCFTGTIMRIARRLAGTLLGQHGLHGHGGHALAGLGQMIFSLKIAYAQGWPEPYICTVYDCMYGDFPAKNTVCTPYIPIHVWF
jgi:hypothetical protein